MTDCGEKREGVKDDPKVVGLSTWKGEIASTEMEGRAALEGEVVESALSMLTGDVCGEFRFSTQLVAPIVLGGEVSGGEFSAPVRYLKAARQDESYRSKNLSPQALLESLGGEVAANAAQK